MALGFGGKYPSKVTCWQKNAYEKYTDIKLSNSSKKQDGTWETDFSAYGRFIGEAHKKAKALNEKDKIIITNCQIQAGYDKDLKVTKLNRIVVWDFTMEDGSQPVVTEDSALPTPDGFLSVPDDMGEDEMPFN